ncbi:MAG: SURF1 family protein [Microbacteriaceae bacterium]
MTESRPRTAVDRRGSRDVVRPAVGGALAKPSAVYDTVTEGLTGRQFLKTGRWIAYIAAAVAFALICGGLALWQFDRGRQASADNAIINANFYAAPVPLEQALPNETAYRSDQNWKRVSATGTYQADDQVVVRNRFRSSNVGFEILTPLRTADGTTIIVDRGWVAQSSGNVNVPAHNPSPPAGQVDVVLRLRPSETAKGIGDGSTGQLQSIDLAQIKNRIGGAVYTGAYGVLSSETPAATTPLAKVQTTPPAEGVGYHYSYTGQWLLFVVIGFFVLGRAIRNEFRRLNAENPDVIAKEAERVQKAARKPFTDEESEDELLDGYIPLTRWC